MTSRQRYSSFNCRARGQTEYNLERNTSRSSSKAYGSTGYNKASFELENRGNGIPFFRDMGFTESKIKEMMLDPKYTMLDAFNGKRFNFGRSITRAKDGFVKKFLESCNDEPEGEKKDYDVGATTIQCCDLLQGECKL